MPSATIASAPRHAGVLASAALVSLAFLATSTAAHGQDAIHGAIGLGVASAPKYSGAEDYRTMPFPFIQLEYRGRAFAGVLPSGLGFGVGAHLHRSEAFGLQVAVAQSNTRKEHYGDALAGMGDQASSATAGAGLTVKQGWVTMTANVALGLDGDVGTVGDVSVAASRTLGSRWLASVSTGVTAADSRNMTFQYGVSQEQAAQRQALIDAGDARLRMGDGEAYAPSAGLREMMASASLAYAMTGRTRMLVFAQGSRLSDEAARSSLVRERNAASGGMALVWGF
jgi:outer membrane protein